MTAFPVPRTRASYATHKTVAGYLQGVGSTYIRWSVRAAFRKRCGGSFPSPLNFKYREILYDAIFETVDELESRQREHPAVEQLNEAMHLVSVDLGWDDA